MSVKYHLFLFFLVPMIVFSQEINQFDHNGKRNGFWIKNYDSGRIKYSGKFLNGKEVGVFYFYENKIINNNPSVKKIFSRTSDIVEVIFFRIDGKLLSKGQTINKKRTGFWEYYDKHRNVVLTEEFKNGKLHGDRIVYFENGKKAELSSYKNGVLDGVSIRYSERSTVLHEMTYKNGLLDGRTSFYDLNGKIKESGLYANDYKVGEWKFYIDGEYVGVKSPNKKRIHPGDDIVLTNIEHKNFENKEEKYAKLSDDKILENIKRKREDESKKIKKLTDKEILENLEKKEDILEYDFKLSDEEILENIKKKRKAVK